MSPARNVDQEDKCYVVLLGICLRSLLALAGAAAAVLAVRDEAEGSVEWAVAAVVRMATHATGEADEFVRQDAFGLIALEAQAGEADLGTHDFLPDLFGLARFEFKFIGGCAAELRVGSEVAPYAEEIPGTPEDVTVAEFFHERGMGFLPNHDVLFRRAQANTETKKIRAGHKRSLFCDWVAVVPAR